VTHKLLDQIARAGWASKELNAEGEGALPERRDPDSKHTGDHKLERRANTRRRRHSIFAALDLGTNNCRLLVATRAPGGFRVIDAFSRIVKLGEGLDSTGNLSRDAMDRAVQALKICAQKIEKRHVTHMRSVATEACRLAANRGDFIDEVREVTGLALDVITTREEARLAVMGCQPLFLPDIRKAIVFDIGGGSTELIGVEIDENGSLDIKGWISLPLGVVRLAETIENAITKSQFDDVESQVRKELSTFKKLLGWGESLTAGNVQLIGSSGTVTTMASLQLGLESYDRNSVDGCALDVKKMAELTKEIAFMSCDDRSALPCIGIDRADLLVPGCAILDAILGMWSFDKISIADRGIREGILRGLMGFHFAGAAGSLNDR
jgi:exopolyphosphatase / guanosine-5'-triphosphate,3'-diphosphate pyrophosphatase